MASETNSTKRSDFRVSFIDSVVHEASIISLEFIKDSGWAAACMDHPNMINHHLVKEHLMQPAKDMMELLKRLGAPPNKRIFLLVFDEVSTLLQSHPDGDSYFALRRV